MNFYYTAKGAKALNSTTVYKVDYAEVKVYLQKRIANEIWLKYHGEDFAPSEVVEKLKNTPFWFLDKRVTGKSDIKLFDGDGEGFYFNTMTGVKTEDISLLKVGKDWYKDWYFAPYDIECGEHPIDNPRLFDFIDFDQIAEDATTLPFPLYRFKYFGI